jgi:hypothetical protein
MRTGPFLFVGWVLYYDAVSIGFFLEIHHPISCNNQRSFQRGVSS